MSTKTASFVLGDAYDQLIGQEIDQGKFLSKSEFFRHVVRNYLEKNTKKHQEES